MNGVEFVFYKNTFLNREIAFALNIEYEYIDSLDNIDSIKKIFVSDKKYLTYLNEKKIERKKEIHINFTI